ncbi:hypothetical protein ACOMHN_049831 [Nucella lapillus]
MNRSLTKNIRLTRNVVNTHKGYCLLYADSTEYGPLATCGYTITVPIIFSLLYTTYMVLSYFCKITFYNRYGYVEETILEFVLTVIMDGVAWIFIFVNSSIISAGFNKMCFNIFSTIERCSEGYLTQAAFGEDRMFYSRLKTAEVASWLSWLLWLMQLVMGIVALRRSGVLPQSSIFGFVCQLLPCRPQCKCSCKMQFKRPVLQTHGNVASPQKAAATPNRIVVALVDSSAVNGQYDKNPFHFQNFDLNFLGITLDGKHVPAKPLTPDFDRKRVTRAYLTTLEGSGLLHKDTAAGFLLDRFTKGYALFCFDLTPSLVDGDQFELVKSAPMRLELKFAKALPNPVVVLIYEELDGLIEVNKSRQVLTDFAV